MRTFRIILVSAAAVAALWIAPGCDGAKPLFESTNLDPHPPEIRNLRVGTASLELDETGIIVEYTYVDDGADIEEVEFINLGLSPEQAEDIVEPVPVDPVLFDPEEGGAGAGGEEVPFFPGRTGERTEQLVLQSSLVGRHVYKMFLTDSKETRSLPRYFYADIGDPR